MPPVLILAPSSLGGAFVSASLTSIATLVASNQVTSGLEAPFLSRYGFAGSLHSSTTHYSHCTASNPAFFAVVLSVVHFICHERSII
jgi:hypothetical protein